MADLVEFLRWLAASAVGGLLLTVRWARRVEGLGLLRRQRWWRL